MKRHISLNFQLLYKGWSQDEMAEKLGMTLHGYAKIELGEVDVNLTRFKQKEIMLLNQQISDLREMNNLLKQSQTR